MDYYYAAGINISAQLGRGRPGPDKAQKLMIPLLALAGRQALPGLHPLQQRCFAVTNGTAKPNVRGPSPRMRALASQDVLTLRSPAASFGVRRTMAGAAGLCGKPPAAKCCEVIDSFLWLCAPRGAGPGRPGLHPPNGRKFTDLHGDKLS